MGYTGINIDPFFTDATGNVQQLLWWMEQDSDGTIYTVSSKSNGFGPAGIGAWSASGRSLTTSATLDMLGDASYKDTGPTQAPFAMVPGGTHLFFARNLPGYPCRWARYLKAGLAYDVGATCPATGTTGTIGVNRISATPDESLAACLALGGSKTNLGEYSIFKPAGPLSAGSLYSNLSSGNQPSDFPQALAFDSSNRLWLACHDGTIAVYTIDTGTLAITKTATLQPYNDGVGFWAITYRPSSDQMILWYSNQRVARWDITAGAIVSGSEFTSAANVTWGASNNLSFVSDRIAPRDTVSFACENGGVSPEAVLTDISTQHERIFPYSLWDGAGLPIASGIPGPSVNDTTNSRIWIGNGGFTGLRILDYPSIVGFTQAFIFGNYPLSS